MTRRQSLVQHSYSLGEIRDIMNAMKTLAYMETRKLSRFLTAQQAVVKGIEAIAADFLSFYPETLPAVAETTRVYLVIGTERGFCGDFNQTLMRHLQPSLASEPATPLHVIMVGRKLQPWVENAHQLATEIDGASVTEEVNAVLNQIVKQLAALQQRYGVLTVYALYHSSDGALVEEKLLPPLQKYQRQARSLTQPPILNQTPAEFLLALTEHYLFAALHEMLYASLMSENLSRITHLDAAVKHIDDQVDDLKRQSNALRQEEIIEEIEVILLNAGNIDQPSTAKETKN